MSEDSERDVASQHFYRAQFFGPFIITRDGADFATSAMSRRAVRTLLKWFLLHPSTRVDAGTLSELLWPGRARGSALNGVVHSLRRALEPELSKSAHSTFVHSDGNGHYWFDPAGYWSSDLGEARSLVLRGQLSMKEGNDQQAISHYVEYLALCQAPFLPEDLYENEFEDVRASHERELGEARCDLLRLFMRNDLTHRALSLALDIQRDDPYSEAAALTIAQVQVSHGNPVAAAQQLESFILVLQEDFRVQPPQNLASLLARIRRRAGCPIQSAIDSRAAQGRTPGRVRPATPNRAGAPVDWPAR